MRVRRYFKTVWYSWRLGEAISLSGLSLFEDSWLVDELRSIGEEVPCEAENLVRSGGRLSERMIFLGLSGETRCRSESGERNRESAEDCLTGSEFLDPRDIEIREI